MAMDQLVIRCGRGGLERRDDGRILHRNQVGQVELVIRRKHLGSARDEPAMAEIERAALAAHRTSYC
eukprot:2819397-Prymnesium_polylepis.1